MSDKRPNIWSELKSGFLDGREERRAELRAEKEKLKTSERIVKGIADGTAQSFNPINLIISAVTK